MNNMLLSFYIFSVIRQKTFWIIRVLYLITIVRFFVCFWNIENCSAEIFLLEIGKWNYIGLFFRSYWQIKSSIYNVFLDLSFELYNQLYQLAYKSKKTIYSGTLLWDKNYFLHWLGSLRIQSPLKPEI